MKPVRCPHCRKETIWQGNPHRPFCSERCKLIDLGQWIEGRYSIPGSPTEPDVSEPGAVPEKPEKKP